MNQWADWAHHLQFSLQRPLRAVMTAQNSKWSGSKCSVPAGAAPRVETRAQLQRALRKAVREQQFEKAAELHRRLDELARGEGASQESSPGPSQPEAK